MVGAVAHGARGLVSVSAVALALACGAEPRPAAAPAAPPEPRPVAEAGPEAAGARTLAVTFDDLPVGGADPGLGRVEVMTRDLLAHVAAGGVPAVGFVNAAKLGDGPGRPARLRFLELWSEAGLELGNHTYSHPSLTRTPLADYEADVLRGEPEIRALNEKLGLGLRWFRHPYLHTGPTMATREAFERFLAEHGYTIAPVTLDNADWLFAAVYADAKGRGDAALMERVGAAYVASMAESLEFDEAAARTIFGRAIPFVLLLHANELNADYFDELIALFVGRGYRFVTLAEAMADAAYRERDGYVGPTGVSWLMRWDETRGPRVDWSAQPGPPAFVRELFEGRG